MLRRPVKIAPSPTPILTPQPPALKPTEEQEKILSLVEDSGDNIIIESLAGTGKTSTCKMIDRAGPEPILYLAFSKRVVTEAEEDRRLAYNDPSILAFSDTTDIRTFNSLGHRVWSEAIGKKRMDVDGRKNSNLLREAIYSRPKRIHSEAFNEFFEITSAAALAKSIGYVPEGKFPIAKRLASSDDLSARLDTKLSDLGWELLDEVLISSIKASYGGTIDYDDQIYMPALFGGTFPSFPLVIVDEGQDLNPCNHAMLRKFRRSRIITVGDSGQSIYAFRGAVTSGMETLKEAFGMAPAELTVSFRCPEAIVRAVHWHRPQMKWIKEGGCAARLVNPSANTIVDNSAVICRNNAPLFRLALQLLSNGRSVNVHGSDVGPRVIAIMRKLGDDNLSRTSVLSAIGNWENEKLARQSSTASDIADCMRVFASHGKTLSAAISYAESLFKQKGTIHLLTGHKAKGLEWDVVFHLDPALCRDDEQDRNLRYVITTRSKDLLYEIDGREIRWPNDHTH